MMDGSDRGRGPGDGPRMYRPKRDAAHRAAIAHGGAPAVPGAGVTDEATPFGALRDLWNRGIATSEAREGLGAALRDITKTAWSEVKKNLDADVVLEASMAAFIELAASRYALDPGAQWKPGEPLRLLLAGYAGTRNTGADVRVEEMIRQFRHLFDDEHVELSILTLDPEKTLGYFRTVRQIHMPKVFPKFIFELVHEQHGVIACEGSMFKSKFANALATLMVGALGLATVEQKIAVGYGGEAGQMDEHLKDLVRRYCQDVLIVARNVASQQVLAELGIESRPGTDTAWTFDPSPAEVGERILREHGWDGKKRVLALCPINPFYWPVKPNVGRAFVNSWSGIYDDAHYGSVYFHEEGADVEAKQERYLGAIANATKTLLKEEDLFVICCGSEALDRKACEDLNELLGGHAPVFVADDYDMYDMVSVMRSAAFMVSSRYHACVTTMAGGVVSGGITMDERIRNLMIDRGQPHLSLDCDDPALEAKTLAMLRTLVRDEDAIRVGIDRCIVKNLERMGRMGMTLVDHVKKRHPEFPFRPELGLHGDPWAHLPSFPPAVESVIARVGRTA